MTSLAKIKGAGFTLSLTDTGNLKIAPFSKLTDTQREFLKQRKQEIIEQITAEAAIKYPRKVACFTPIGGTVQVMAKSAEHEAFLLKMDPVTEIYAAQFHPQGGA